MAKVKISDYSTTNSSNTDINSINIDEGCAPSGINNAIREVMVHLKNWQTNASGDGATFANLVVQGTGSFTGAVTMSAGATLSGTNTLSGSNIISGNINSSGTTNTFSGTQVISGNINSSGSANTFSGSVALSGGTANGVLYLNGSKVATSGSALVFDGAILGLNDGTLAGLDFYNSGAATDEKRYRWQSGSLIGNGILRLRLLNDANTNGTNAWVIDRTGIDIDYQAWSAGSSEQMRLTSTGLGIGTSSPNTKLEVVGAIRSNNSVSNFECVNGAQIATFNLYDANTVEINSFSGTSPKAIRFSGYTTEYARFDSSGNLGLGVGAPNYKLDIASGAIQVKTGASISNSQYDWLIGYSGTEGYGVKITTIQGSTSTRHGMAFYTSAAALPAERMRIDESGELWVAGTTDQGAYNIQCNGTGVWGAGAYVNGSDERIKDDIAPIESGLDVVEKLNPVTYRYKEDWSKDQSVQTGFIAQELLVALEGKNYVDGVVQQGGSEGYYSVAYQNIIPILTKAIQELSAKLDEANERIAALEAK